MRQIHLSSAPLRPLLLVAAVLLVLGARAVAQPHHYGLNDKGRVIVDGVVLDKLKSGYDPGDDTNFQQRWLDLFVLGSDRFSVRLDGLVYHNGAKLWNLPAFGFFYWIGITGGMQGEDLNVWTLRNDGVVAKNGEVIAVLPLCDGCGFSDLVSDGTSVWVLRTDGNVYKDTVASPAFTFVGGDGVNGNPDGTLGDSSTWWTRLALDGDMLYALRQDGIVFLGDVTGGDAAGTLQTDLAGPPGGASSVLSGNLYLDLTMDASGRWLALRGDGTVYRSDNTLIPLLDFKGDPVGNSSSAQLFFDVETDGDTVSALRFDGKLFTDADEDEELVDFSGERFFVYELSNDPPDLSNIKNGKPRAAKVKGFGVAGEAVSLELKVTDTDKAESDLVVTVVEPLPEGSVWDPDARTLSWAAPAAGNWKAQFLVDDGEAKPIKAKLTLKVIDADVDPDKNKPPLPTKLKGVQALVGIPLELTVQAADPDGDELTLAAVEDLGVFGIEGSDASFDPDTGAFGWTPTFDDIGSNKARFLISDGQKTKKLNLKIKVVNSLIFSEG